MLVSIKYTNVIESYIVSFSIERIVSSAIDNYQEMAVPIFEQGCIVLYPWARRFA